MSIRRRVAERIAIPLKRVGGETPILDQIPHAAEELSSFYYQLEQSVQGQVAGRLAIPAFAHGKAYGEVAGMWYRVKFPKPIMNADVTCVAQGRSAEKPKPTAPKITLRTIEMPELKPIEVPVVSIPYLNESFPYFSAGEICLLGVCAKMGWTQGWADSLNRVMNSLRRIQSRTNDGIGAINEGFAKARKAVEDVHTSLRDFREKAQASVNEQIKDVEASINTGLGSTLDLLYKVWGIPSNMAITPLHVRNVTSTGFEFQSLGKVTAHWICLGQKA